MLQDIAILTGGRVITEELGLKLENTTIEDLGEARKVIADKDSTTIVEGKGKKSDIDARVSEIKVEINNTSSDYDKEKLQERLAKLSGGVAIIKVGAATEIELKEKKHRIEDALAATRAAVEEGIIPGGGTALLRSAAVLSSLVEKAHSSDEKVGIKLVQKALEYPLRQIAQNCGLEGSVIVQKVLDSKNQNDGFNATDEKVEDLVKAGIIDPKKVARAAIQNAGSVAGVFLTTEAAITDIPEEEKPDPAAMGGGMGGMGGMM
jgi:chaperonin GroEL